VFNDTPLPIYPRKSPQGRSGRVWKVLRPPGMDPPTLQPVHNRCPGKLLLHCHWSQQGTHKAMPGGTGVCSSSCMYQQKYDKSDEMFGSRDAKLTPVHLTMWLRFLSARWSCERTVIFWHDGEGSHFYGYDSEGIIFISIT